MKIKCNIIYGIVKYQEFPPSFQTTLKSLDDMARLGFKYVELDVADETLNDFLNGKDKLRKVCQEKGLIVANVTAYFPDLFSIDSVRREKALKNFLKTVELASYLDADLIMTDSFPPPIEMEAQYLPDKNLSALTPKRVRIPANFDWNKCWNTFVEGIRQCDKIAEQEGHRFCIEPVPGHIIATTDGMLRLMDAVNSENFGAVLDVASAYYQREVVPLSILKLGKRLFMLHVSDNDGILNYHLCPGEGSIDWNEIVNALKMIRFEDYVAVDVRAPPEIITEKYKKAKEFCEKSFAVYLD